MASVRVPRGQASVDSSVLKTPDWKDAVRAMGVDPETILTTSDDVLASLKDLWARHHRPPRQREIADALGCSHGFVSDRLTELARAGKVLRVEGGAGNRTFYVPAQSKKEK